MPTRALLAPSQRAQFTELPAAVDDRTLAGLYALSSQDLQLIGHHRCASTQLGFAVQVGYACFPGRVLRVGEDSHAQMLAILASQLGVYPAATPPARPGHHLHGHDTTHREHVLELQRQFGIRSFSAAIYHELAGWLLPIVLTPDVGTSPAGPAPGRAARTQGASAHAVDHEALECETRRRAERIVLVRLTAAFHRCTASAGGLPADGAARRADDHTGEVAPPATETHTGHFHGPG